MTLTPRQKRAIIQGDAKWRVVAQLFRKGLAHHPEDSDEFLHPDSKARMAVIRLTDEGKQVRRMIDDPTVDHI